MLIAEALPMPIHVAALQKNASTTSEGEPNSMWRTCLRVPLVIRSPIAESGHVLPAESVCYPIKMNESDSHCD